MTPACHVPKEAGGWEGQRNMEILTREQKDHPAQARKYPETGGVIRFFVGAQRPTLQVLGMMFVNS